MNVRVTNLLIRTISYELVWMTRYVILDLTSTNCYIVSWCDYMNSSDISRLTPSGYQHPNQLYYLLIILIFYSNNLIISCLEDTLLCLLLFGCLIGKQTKVAQPLTLADKNGNQRTREEGTESRDAPDPVDAYFNGPRRVKELDGHGKCDAVHIERSAHLLGVTLENLNDVVDRGPDTRRGAKDNHAFGHGEHHVVEVVKDGGAKEAQADGLDDQAREPRRVQSILWVPDAAASPLDPQGQTVVDEYAIANTNQRADPGRKVEVAGAIGREAESAHVTWRHQDNGYLNSGHDEPTIINHVV
jgi:hypothetical protein